MCSVACPEYQISCPFRDSRNQITSQNLPISTCWLSIYEKVQTFRQTECHCSLAGPLAIATSSNKPSPSAHRSSLEHELPAPRLPMFPCVVAPGLAQTCIVRLWEHGNGSWFPDSKLGPWLLLLYPNPPISLLTVPWCRLQFPGLQRWPASKPLAVQARGPATRCSLICTATGPWSSVAS